MACARRLRSTLRHLLALCACVVVVAPASATTNVPDGLSASDWTAVLAQLPARAKGMPSGSLQSEGAVMAPDTGGGLDALSVAVSGRRMVVGVQGAAHVFHDLEDSGGWLLDRSMGGGPGFGVSVAVSPDAIIVGDAGSSGGSNDGGGVWLYGANGGGTYFPAPAQAGSGGGFARSMALRDNLLVVGAPGLGQAYVFHVASGGYLSFLATLAPANGLGGAGFGSAVAMWGDTVAVGAPFATGPGSTSHAGAVQVFHGNGGFWSGQEVLYAPSPAADARFGASVAVSGQSMDSAQTLLVGAPFHDHGNRGGDAYVFERSGGAWGLQATLQSPQPDGFSMFGRAVALAGDMAAVGAPWEGNGAVHVFRRSGTQWQAAQRLEPTSPPAGQMGAVLALDPLGVLAAASPASGFGKVDVFAPAFELRVEVDGLDGSGLVLRDQGHETLTVDADGVHSFPDLRRQWSAYDVRVETQPAGPALQTCHVNDGTGHMWRADVTLRVECVDVRYAVATSVHPAGSGTLHDASGNDLSSVPHGTQLRLVATPMPGWNAADPLTYFPMLNCHGDVTPLAPEPDGSFVTPPIEDADCTVHANFANQAPGFVGGAAPAVDADSGEFVAPAWASAVRSGNDGDDGQTVAFELTPVDAHPSMQQLFAVGGEPHIAPDGTLRFTPAGVAGQAVFDVVLRDDGGAAHGGADASAPQRLHIRIGLADLAIRAALPEVSWYRGQRIGFAIVVDNAGHGDALDTAVAWNAPSALRDVSWFCVAHGESTCAGSGLGNIDDSVDVAADGRVEYVVEATLPDDDTRNIPTSASATPAPSQAEPLPADATAQWDLRVDGVFRDGLEPGTPP